MRVSLNGLARLVVFQLVIKLPVWLLREFRRPNYWWWGVIISDKCYEIRKKVLERGSKERKISNWREWRERLKIAESVDNFQNHRKFEFAPFVIFFPLHEDPPSCTKNCNGYQFFFASGCVQWKMNTDFIALRGWAWFVLLFLYHGIICCIYGYFVILKLTSYNP